MATSGSTDFTVTRDQLITEALENLGVIDVGGTAGTSDINSASTTLNILVKGLQADRLFLRFIDSSQTISLADGTAAYDADTGTLRILDGWLRISNTDYPMEFIDATTYDGIPNKASESQPYQVYVDYSPTLPKLYFYPTPDASYTFHYRRERAVEDFDATANNPDFPVKAQDMLVTGLTHRLAPKYGLPISERQYWEQQFEKARNAYRAGDTERHSRNIVAPKMVV